MFTLNGTVERLSPVQHIGEKNYPKQLVWIQTGGKYPQTVELEAFGDRANDTSILSIGDQVEFTFDLKGRKWTGKDGIEKCFTTLSILKVEAKGKTSYKEQAKDVKTTQAQFAQAMSEPDNLPF
jgi:hypothetical protein